MVSRIWRADLPSRRSRDFSPISRVSTPSFGNPFALRRFSGPRFSSGMQAGKSGSRPLSLSTRPPHFVTVGALGNLVSGTPLRVSTAAAPRSTPMGTPLSATYDQSELAIIHVQEIEPGDSRFIAETCCAFGVRAAGDDDDDDARPTAGRFATVLDPTSLVT